MNKPLNALWNIFGAILGLIFNKVIFYIAIIIINIFFIIEYYLELKDTKKSSKEGKWINGLDLLV